MLYTCWEDGDEAREDMYLSIRASTQGEAAEQFVSERFGWSANGDTAWVWVRPEGTHVAEQYQVTVVRGFETTWTGKSQ